jgi:heterodisulfide reductase subunit C
MARAMAPVALAADRINLRAILLVVHYLSCFLGLALLPFSKMLHILTSPLSLLVNAVMSKDHASPANVATRQVLELDACTHCGLCTEHCAVAVAFQEIPNVNILPSEKIASIRKVAAGRELTSSALATIQQGMFLCTNCYRCTTVCPVGIDLQGLWFSVRERLLLKHLPEYLLLSPFSLYRGLMQSNLDPLGYRQPVDDARKAVADSCDLEVITNRSLPLHPGNPWRWDGATLEMPSSTFRHCYRCMTCSNACPVVQNHPNASEVLGLLPHQIMHALGLKLWDIILSSRMLWDCLGCYRCQEHCPMNVRPADIIYQLKNVAVQRALSQFSQSQGGK